MTKPLVSVKMITYNHEPFIAQAIEGVLQQKTNFPFELVIGEDCSTDGTREIVFEYQKKHPDIIRVITSDSNVGMSKNGLRTTRGCQGKYLAYCEGDDFWQSPDKLQKQADYLEGHPECGLVFSSYDVYHVKTKKTIKDFVTYRKWNIPEDHSISDIVEGKSQPLTCTVMVRRDLYDRIVEADPYLHQSGHFLMGDTQLWAEMTTKARLHFMPESFATHNITEESASRSRDVKKELRFSLSNAELFLYLCSKYNLPQSSRDKHERCSAECSLRLAFHTKNKELADEARRKNTLFSSREWLLYYGTKYLLIYYPLRLAFVVRNLIRKKNAQWK